MGGPVAELLARHHPGAVRGLVLSATALNWHGLRMRLFWSSMGLLRLGLGAFPTKAWELLLKPMGTPPGTMKEWVAAEVTRGSSVDIAEAGRELGRFDATSWIGELRDIPSAVIVTARDRSVLPGKQRALAAALGARQTEIQADHLAALTRQREYRRLLLDAIAAISEPVAVGRASAAA
jgi:pimeloyl-ACP methyl ester carboxylesterase